MDHETNTAKEPKNTENDEVDGSVISRFRRRRGVKVSGRYIPPLEWEKVNASHSVSSLNSSYFEKVYDDMQHFFQASDLSTKLLLKDERQGSTQTDHRGVNTHKTEQEKQRMEPVASSQAPDTKNTENMPQEKINHHKTDDANATEKSDEDVLPCGSAIPKETLEELKIVLKESPFILHKNKRNPNINTTVTQIQLPKRVENTREKSGLTFETFRPHLEKEVQQQQPAEKQSHEILMDLNLPDPVEGQNDEKLIQHIQTLNGKKILPDQISIATETKYEPPATVSKEGLPASSKDVDHHGSVIQDPCSKIALLERVKQQIAREDIRFVRFEATDLHGVSRSKTISSRFFQDKAVNGICMPRSYLELTLDPKDNQINHISSKQSNSDILLKPDIQTFRVLPWTEKTARVICDPFSFLGNPLLTSPRYLAKRLLNQLQEKGFLLSSAFIYEFCIFGVAEIINSKTISFPAATLLSDHQMFMQELLEGMYYIGGNIESFSSSSAPGQMEISFQPEYGLAAADNAFTFKTGIKEAAKKQDYIVSFYTDSVGFYNSGVLSHSLWDVSGTKNVFHTGSRDEVLTDIGRKWLSGLLHHSAALSCLVAPGAACRKRFLKNDKDSQDSICATWGSNNNTCTYNIKSRGRNGTYIENMMCSATANPYLVLAATIAAGLDGIRRGLDLFEGTNNHTRLETELKEPSIPLKLEDALSALEADTCMRSSLGDPFIRHFMAMKRYELETEEGDTERNKFLEYFI